jgi:hypothetical protein
MKLDTDSCDASKRTLLGVGLSSLLAVRPVREPSIVVADQVSGEITSDRPGATGRAAPGAETPRLAYPPFRAKRSWTVVALVTIGALGLSVAAGFAARWMFSGDTTPARTSTRIASSRDVSVTPIVTPAATASASPRKAATAGSPAPRREATEPATKARIATKSVPAIATTTQTTTQTTRATANPTANPTPAQTPAQMPTPTIEQRSVHLGDGSCTLLVDSTLIGSVSVDEQPVGQTPVLVSGLWCGRALTVQIYRAGFEAWRTTVRTQEGRMSRIMAAPRRALPRPENVAPTIQVLPAPAAGQLLRP